MSFHFHTSLNPDGTLSFELQLEIHGDLMAASASVIELVSAIGTLVALCTRLANRTPANPEDKALLAAALADAKEATDGLGVDQSPSVLTEDAPVGATDLKVDSSAGWTKGERGTIAPNGIVGAGETEDVVCDATMPRPDANTIRVAAPGTKFAHKAGEIVGV
jgi:hypothetical protein